MAFYGHFATLEHNSDTLVCLLFLSSETFCCKIIDYQKLSVENYSGQEEAVYTYWQIAVAWIHSQGRTSKKRYKWDYIVPRAHFQRNRIWVHFAVMLAHLYMAMLCSESIRKVALLWISPKRYSSSKCCHVWKYILHFQCSRLRQKYHEFKPILLYIARLCLKNKHTHKS